MESILYMLLIHPLYLRCALYIGQLSIKTIRVAALTAKVTLLHIAHDYYTLPASLPLSLLLSHFFSLNYFDLED